MKGLADRVRKKAGGEKIRYRIEVHRCTSENCGRSNRLLPDIWLPYKHYEAELIEDVVDGVIRDADLDEYDYPCEATVKRWKDWMDEMVTYAEGQIRAAAHRILDLPDRFLAETESLLDKIQEKIPQGWLKAITGILINTSGSPIMVESG